MRARRRLTALLVMGVMMAVMLVAGAGYAFAAANPDADPPTGKAATAPGQVQALTNCEEVFFRQLEMGVSAGGGPKEGIPGPENCDHFFHNEGIIGNQ